MRARWSLVSALGAAAVAAMTALPAAAQEITYTESAILSGTFDDVAFADDTVVFTLTGDTSDIVNNGGGFYTLNGTATVSLNGGPAYTLTGTTTVYAEPGLVGFHDDETLSDFNEVNVAAFEDYDLSTAIGPTTGNAESFNDGVYPTSGGVLELTDIEGYPTFTATVDTVPEPSSLALLASALGGLGGVSRRHRRRAS